MNATVDLENLGGADRVVYVRAVDPAELPEQVQSEIGSATQLYAVHAPNGERLAVVKDRALAFTLARQNDFSPVTVH